ncbi:hypothetical protein HK102_013225 [Quaeritorhiza haematococci]|nr:hypothetical protein HK102_013225 [Quaeritorhiza haematococci]
MLTNKLKSISHNDLKHWIFLAAASVVCCIFYLATRDLPEPGSRHREPSSSGSCVTLTDHPDEPLPAFLLDRSPYIALTELESSFRSNKENENGACPVDFGNLPPGLLTNRECCFLYHMGKHTPGPLYEKGPFRGQSTACIAKGVKDSGAKKVFVTMDMFPLGAFIIDQWPVSQYPYRYIKYPQFISLSVDGIITRTLSVEQYEKELKKLHETPGGMLSQLIAGLVRAQLLPYVHIMTGTTAPDLEYSFVYVEMLEGLADVEVGLAELESLLRDSRRTVFVFHDAVSAAVPQANNTEALIKESQNRWVNKTKVITQRMEVLHQFQMDTLYVVEAKQKKEIPPPLP